MSERLIYLPERCLADDGIHKVGVVVFVVNREGEVWTVQEHGKLNHQGEVGVLCETRKSGETIWDNTQAALIEEMGTRTEDSGDFYYVDKVSYLGRFPFPEGKKKIHADVVLVLYDGNNRDFQSRNEVIGLGWRQPETLKAASNLRCGIVPALEAVLQEGTIDRLLSASGHRRQVLANVDISHFFQMRSQQRDISF